MVRPGRKAGIKMEERMSAEGTAPNEFVNRPCLSRATVSISLGRVQGWRDGISFAAAKLFHSLPEGYSFAARSLGSVVGADGFQFL